MDFARRPRESASQRPFSPAVLIDAAWENLAPRVSHNALGFAGDFTDAQFGCPGPGRPAEEFPEDAVG